VCAAQPYYVSPTGDDTNPGSLEKPFATLQRAQQAAHQKHGTVFLRGGTYYLPSPLVFTAEDSGTPDTPEIIQDYQNEKPVISGGVRLTNLDWRPCTNGIFQTQVPADLQTEEIFVAGKTPSVKPRLYVHFTGTTAPAQLTLGLNNPTRASSETPGHTGRQANDGNAETFWQAEATDKNAWLRVDLERNVTVNRTKLTFPSEGNWQYKVEVSDNGDTDWRLFTDQTQATATTRERTDSARGRGIPGRFVRVTVTGSPAGQSAGLAEVQVSGTQPSR
jgi:hypothetical protein